MHRRTSSVVVSQSRPRTSATISLPRSNNGTASSKSTAAAAEPPNARRMRSLILLLSLVAFMIFCITRAVVKPVGISFDPKLSFVKPPGAPRYPPPAVNARVAANNVGASTASESAAAPPAVDGLPARGPNVGSSGSSSSSPPSIGQSNVLKGFKLTTAEELAAVVSYLTNVGSHAHIPSSIDPTQPIPAELILGFNTRSADKARAEVQNLVAETWALNPVVMFTESRSPSSRDVKALFKTYDLAPEPVVIDVNERDDRDLLAPLLYRLTHATSLPLVLIGGEPQLYTYDEFVRLGETNDLAHKLNAAGAIVDGAKKHGHKHR